MKLMRYRVVNKTQCEPLPQLESSNLAKNKTS